MIISYIFHPLLVGISIMRKKHSRLLAGALLLGISLSNMTSFIFLEMFTVVACWWTQNYNC
jgi:hypothetical protein